MALQGRTAQEIAAIMAASGLGTNPSLRADGSVTNEAMAQQIRDKLIESGQHDSVLDQGKNFFGQVVDVIGRPLNVIDNVLEDYVNRATDRAERGRQEGQGYLERLGGSVLEFLEPHPSQVWQGLSGQQTVRGSDILNRLQETSGHDLKGPVEGALGFGLDVVFDPLSYVGPGIARRVGEETLVTEGAKAAELTRQEGLRRGSQLFKDSRRLAAEALAEEGGAGTKTLTRSRLKELRNSFIDEEATRSGANVREALLKENPGTFGLKSHFTGNPLGPQSEALYDIGSKLSGAVGDTAVGRAFNKALRPVSTYVGQTHEMIRRNFGKGGAEGENLLRTLDKGGKYVNRSNEVVDLPGFNSLDESTRNSITHLAQNGGIDPKLQTHAEVTRDVLDNVFSREAGTTAMGNIDHPLMAAEKKIDNYMPTVWQHSDDPIVLEGRKEFESKMRKDATKQVGKRLENAEKASDAAIRAAKKKGETNKAVLAQIGQDAKNSYIQSHKIITTYTIDHAKNLGLAPVEDVRELLAARIYKHTNKMSRIGFASDVGLKYGVPLNKTASKNADKLGLVRTSNEYLPRDIHFPKEVEKAIATLDETLYKNGDTAGSELLDLYDNALSQLKFFQTVASPGHHIRNALGDLTNNFLDGVNTIEPYTWSTKIQKATRSGEAILGRNLDITSEALDDLHIPVGGRTFDGNQITNYFTEGGGRAGMVRTEILTKPGTTKDLIRGVGEAREDWARMAHFIDAFQKEGAHLTLESTQAEIKAAAQKAGARVRKFNIDYSDLTPFEQKYLKRIVPFYTWMRKNVPLQIENLAMNPQRSMVGLKAIKNLQYATGQTPEDFQLAGINALPGYIQEMMGIKVSGGEGAEGNFFDPKTLFPVMDLSNFFGGQGTGPMGALPSGWDMLQAQGAGLTPALQIPLEHLTGHSFFQDSQMDRGLLEQLVTTTPQGRLAYENLAPGAPPSDPQRRLLNMILGTGLQGVTEGSSRGELRRQEDIVDALLRQQRERSDALTQAALAARYQQAGP